MINFCSGETIGIHCFEISVSTRNQLLLFGVPSISERHIWMRKLLESVGPGFSAKLSMDYTKAGWCYAKVRHNKIREFIIVSAYTKHTSQKKIC